MPCKYFKHIDRQCVGMHFCLHLLLLPHFRFAIALDGNRRTIYSQIYGFMAGREERKARVKAQRNIASLKHSKSNIVNEVVLCVCVACMIRCWRRRKKPRLLSICIETIFLWFHSQKSRKGFANHKITNVDEWDVCVDVKRKVTKMSSCDGKRKDESVFRFGWTNLENKSSGWGQKPVGNALKWSLLIRYSEA